MASLRTAILECGGVAGFCAKRLEHATDLPHDDDKDGLSFLASETLLKLSYACDRAMVELRQQSQSGGSFQEGRAWAGWFWATGVFFLHHTYM